MSAVSPRNDHTTPGGTWRPLTGTSTGRPSDAEVGLDWADGSAFVDDPDLQRARALMRNSARPPRDAQQVVERLACLGNAEAQAMLGHWNFYRYVETANDEAAAGWFARAAAQGHVLALVRLGNCLKLGRGVPADPGRAFELFQLAAKCGDRYGMHELGRCFEEGTGVIQDRAQATEWYMRSRLDESSRRLARLGFEMYFERPMRMRWRERTSTRSLPSAPDAS